MIPAPMLASCTPPLSLRPVETALDLTEAVFDLRPPDAERDGTEPSAADLVQLAVIPPFWLLPSPARDADAPVLSGPGASLGPQGVVATGQKDVEPELAEAEPAEGTPPSEPVAEGVAEGVELTSSADLAVADVAEPALSDGPDVPEGAARSHAPPPNPQVAETVRAFLYQAGGDAGDGMLPDLGPVELDIRTEAETVFVTLRAERPETLDLFRRHAADLMAELRAAGFSQASLSFAARGSGAQPGAGLTLVAAETDDSPARYPHHLALSGGVDLRI